MDSSTPESLFGIDASACLDVSSSYIRVGKTMGVPPTSQTMDRSPENPPQIWCVSSKPTIHEGDPHEGDPDVNVLSGDNQVDVGIRPELDNIRVNLCSCLISVECCSKN
jgi:hypothetical protein